MNELSTTSGVTGVPSEQVASRRSLNVIDFGRVAGAIVQDVARYGTISSFAPRATRRSPQASGIDVITAFRSMSVGTSPVTRRSVVR